MSPRVAIVNASTVIGDSVGSAYTAALAIQVSRDLAPAWGTPASVYYVPKGGSLLNPADWAIALVDNPDIAGALGYHDTTKTGQPFGKAFMATSLHAGVDPCSVISHELCELLVDPRVQLCASKQTRTSIEFVALETCDAVENDSYSINGEQVSNFVLPPYFDAKEKSGVKYDFLGLITAPFEIRPGGYLSVFIPGRGWTQQTHGDVETVEARGPVGSRREKREHGARIPSTAI